MQKHAFAAERFVREEASAIGRIALFAIATSVLLLGRCSSQDSFYHALRSECRVASENLPARRAVQRLQQAHSINVWLDRNVDPSIKVNLPGSKSDVEQAFQSVASQLNAEVAFVDAIAIIAPKSKASLIATAILLQRETLRKRGDSRAKALLKRKDFAWPPLTTPEEALVRCNQLWGEGVFDYRLEHDLWPAVAFENVDAPAMAVLISSGFGLLPKLATDGTSFQLLPSPTALSAVQIYPAGKVSRELIAEMQELEPAISVAPRGSLVEIDASAVVHHEIRKRQISKAPMRSGTAGVAPLDKVYSFRVEAPVPAGAGLKKIASDSGALLDVSSVPNDKLNVPVQLMFKDTSVREILRQTCDKAGLKIEFDGARAIVKP